MPLLVVDLTVVKGVQLNFIFNIKKASLSSENTSTDELLGLRLILRMAGSDQSVRLTPTSVSSIEFPCDLNYDVSYGDISHFEEINLIGIEIIKELVSLEISKLEIYYKTCDQ